jgi:outer membrane protein assembly factor BamB
LVSSGQAYLAIEPRTGQEQWRFRWVTQYGANAADPIIDGERVFISTGYGKGGALLKPDRGPEATVLWKNKNLRTQRNAAVLLGGHLFGVDGDAGGKAALKCVDIATGEVKWSEPAVGSGALMAADGKLIVLGDHGELIVALAAPESFKPTARAQVLGGKCWTVPVLANGLIWCRNSRGDVVCVDARPQAR